MADIPLAVAGDDQFVLGMDSYTQPSKLNPGEYVVGMNIINRGGLAQTRPGSKSLLDLPSGQIQGLTFFTPASGIPHLVMAVGGLVYASKAPFTSYFQLPNIQFSPYSKYVSWASCIKSTDYTDSGLLYYLDNPHAVLVMQDGNTRAAYWDGTSNGHINPTPSGQELTLPDRDGTKIGLWMAWSNNRLWVSRDNQVFASDIGNPLKFTESQYLNEGRAFYLDGNCTGMVESSDASGVIAFTANSGTMFLSSVQDRTKWLSTAGFVNKIVPNIGCVAPRSIVQQYGLLWWYTQKGLLNQDSALNLNVTSRLNIQDNEMFQSKFDLSNDLSMVCGTYKENFLFHAVPNGDKLNTRVHVLDQAPFENGQNSWAAYWTGWRPVEFAKGTISSQERIFCISYDYDGVNRAWEMFLSDKTDNGMPITSSIVTRQHYFDNRDWKRFRYAELEFDNIAGDTAVMVAAAGTRGAFQPIMTKDISATIGQVYAQSLYGNQETDYAFGGSRPQRRIVRTQDGSNPSECNDACVEFDDHRGLTDKAFSLMVTWSGIAGLSAYRIFSQNEPTAYQGICEDDETGQDRLVTPDGCSMLGPFSDSSPFPTYLATATFSRINPSTGILISHTSTQSSNISQVDADRKASTQAQWYVLHAIGEIL